MRAVGLPDTGGVPQLVRAFAACVASVTQAPVSAVPQPGADLTVAIAHVRSWLAAKGAGLVPIANAARFNWPGYWVAVLGDAVPGRLAQDEVAVLMFGTPAGVVLSPQDPTLLGTAATDLPVRGGYVVSGLDPAFAAHESLPLLRLRGTVEAIALAERATAPMVRAENARALAGRGLEGDR